MFRQSSENRPHWQKTGLGGGLWLLPASTTIVLVVIVSLYANFGFERVISNRRFYPSVPPQFCIGESGLDLADYRLPLSPEANRQLAHAALKRFAFLPIVPDLYFLPTGNAKTPTRCRLACICQL